MAEKPTRPPQALPEPTRKRGLAARVSLGKAFAPVPSEFLLIASTAILLTVFGLVMILSATSAVATARGEAPYDAVLKQAVFAAIGLPLLIRTYGGDPAIVCAIGMLAGFCGTLMTPMAANFNLVPAALLDLKDKHGVIKRQVGTAVPLLVVNILLIYWLAFP